MPAVAIATCASLPDLDPDELLLVEALRAAGVQTDITVWTDPGVLWRTYDAVVIRATWDYTDDWAGFLEWATRVDTVSTLLNPSDIVAWTTDTRYLRDLQAAGVPVVPTTFIEPGTGSTAQIHMPDGYEHLVVKPAVSAGSRDTMRYAIGEDLAAAGEHADRLLAESRIVMVQPYLEAVDTIGETAMIHIDGRFSHAIRKGPMLTAGKQGEMAAGGLYVKEQIDPREATEAELAVARAALAAVPGGADRLLYARVDVIQDITGTPLLLELELTEPSLFLRHEPTAAAAMAQAIIARL